MSDTRERDWQMGAKPEKRVVVAMSGGVDSSLTAALLQHQGYDVVGVTMNLWENENSNPDRAGCSSTAAQDAAKVAAMLGIEHYVFDFTDIFQKKVIDYFCSEYSAGRTPNPCVACNRSVKFGALLDKSLELGARYMATGHYARIVYDGERQRRLLLKGVDLSKDQSYVLYHLTQRALGHFLTPLGGYTKKQTRELASKWGLVVADKPESQEICFIPDNDYKSFLREKAPDAFQAGKIVDTSGNIIGEHGGVQFFTVGQRKGLGVALGRPAYVVAINPEKNEVVIGGSEEVFAGELTAGDLNFISIDCLEEPLFADVKIRYAAPPARAKLVPLSGGAVRVEFQKPQRAITPGQAVVFYNEDEVIGGGTIFS